MRDFLVVIPAFNPTASLIHYVHKLIDEKIPSIIVVNDGSRKEFMPIFERLAKVKGCTVLHHKENLGKGQALKTAFHHVLEKGVPWNVVTADCDGQHSVSDVLQVGEALQNIQDGIVLGTRNFREKSVPFRSLIGNILTNRIFHLLFSYPLKDTQTGLRGIPFPELASITKLHGDRYEYEMNMLIFMAKQQATIKEVPIQTLYFNNNANSYYHPFKDSLKILNTILFNIRISNN